jgi:hypothetical protein
MPARTQKFMITDQLIKLLVADLKPVDRARVSRALVVAMLIGAAVPLAVVFLILVPRHDVFGAENVGYLLLKLLFTLSVVATAAGFLPELARPAPEARNFAAFVSAPFIAIAVLAAVALGSSDLSSWGSIILGRGWLTCLFSIPLLAILPFAALVWAWRAGAPTDRMRAGTAAGLGAGGLSAAACAFLCPDDALPSIALWYGPTIGICAISGAKLAPSLLRW